jgi:hypothetical protein
MIDRGLRRADWRFLLPTPSSGCFNHLVLLGGDNEQAEMLVDTGIARCVTREIAAPGAADAVVLLRRAKASLKDAGRMLQSGGVFYAEVDRRLSGRRWLTPRKSERQLREAGLSPTGVYLVLPRFEAGRRYVPIDHPGLLDWYFATLHSAGTPLALIASAGFRFAAGFKYRRLGSVAPWYGVTAVSGSLPSPPPSVLGHPELPDSVRPSNVRVLMLTNGQDDGSRVVILPFAWEAKEPVAAVKVSRAVAFNGNTEREQAALSHIRQRLDQGLRRSIPEPLGLVQYAGLAVAVEGCAAGTALTATTGHLGRGFSNAVEDLRFSITWLAEFHRQTRTGSNRWTSEDAAHLDVRLEQYAKGLQLADKTRELLRKTSAHSSALIGAMLPKVCLHNDFGPWNVYRQGDRITVIDWELGGNGTADRTGPGLCDLVYFVTYWTLRTRRLWSEAATRRGFRELFLDPSKGGRASRAAHATIREYLVRAGIDPRFLPPLLVYTWIERTLDQLARARAGGHAVLPAAVEQYAQFVNLLAEHGERLFNDPLP